MLKLNSKGFSIVEVVIACVVFPLLVIAISNAYDAVRKSYTVSRELNEIYAVLSACPEIDRALQYDSITNDINCYPNNSFRSEGAGNSTITYNPTLTVTKTSDLPESDPLKTIPDSKVIFIKTGYVNSPATPPELRMLITRNGIGQL